MTNVSVAVENHLLCYTAKSRFISKQTYLRRKTKNGGYGSLPDVCMVVYDNVGLNIRGARERHSAVAHYYSCIESSSSGWTTARFTFMHNRSWLITAFSTMVGQHNYFAGSNTEGMRTGVSGRRVAELVSLPRRRPHADEPAQQRIPRLEHQLRLHCIRVRVAAVRHVVDGARVSSLRHEHLGGVVFRRVLRREQTKTKRVSFFGVSRPKQDLN